MKNKIEIANRYLTEEDKSNTIKIYYSDLSLDARKNILDAIDKSNEYLNLFGDDVVKDKIETAFQNTPLFTIDGDEILKKMNVDV